PRSGAATAQRIPVDRGGRAAAGALWAKFCFVEVGLFDANVLPIDIEFVGENHREVRFDAVARFGILAQDGDGAVGRDSEKSERGEGRLRSCGCGRALREGRSERSRVKREEYAASGKRTDFQEFTAGKKSGRHKTPRGVAGTPILAPRGA